MAKMKRTRTNYAPEFETLEAMDAAVTLDEAMTAFLLSKKAERASERTLKDYQSHFRYFKAWIEIERL